MDSVLTHLVEVVLAEPDAQGAYHQAFESYPVTTIDDLLLLKKTEILEKLEWKRRTNRTFLPIPRGQALTVVALQAYMETLIANEGGARLADADIKKLTAKMFNDWRFVQRKKM